MFGKKQINSDEYERLSKSIIDLKNKIDGFEGELNKLDTLLRNLRGVVNRKLYKEDEQEPSKDINTTVLLPYNGSFK